MTTIGSLLKSTRQAQHLTQAATAAGICAQSMLSAIEHERYMPKADLLIALCQRLGINLTQLALADNYAISGATDFNQQVSQLCDQHQYAQLLTFLKKAGGPREHRECGADAGLLLLFRGGAIWRNGQA